MGHRHVMRIWAVRAAGRLRYCEMKYMPEHSLDPVLADTGPAPMSVVQADLPHAGGALEHAHGRG